MRIRVAAAFIAVAMLVALLSGYAGAGLTSKERVVVSRQGASSVDVKVRMGAGELWISGGARELLEAEFLYSDPDWKPRVDYRLLGKAGVLEVEPPDLRLWDYIGDHRYEWNLKLSNDVPMRLEVTLGAGVSHLRLGGMLLDEVDIQMGVGECTLDLTGKWREDVYVNIRGGVGKAHIVLPKDTGIELRAQGGIGRITVSGLKRDGDAYVNDHFRKSPVLMRVRVQGGIGEINVEVAD